MGGIIQESRAALSRYTRATSSESAAISGTLAASLSYQVAARGHGLILLKSRSINLRARYVQEMDVVAKQFVQAQPVRKSGYEFAITLDGEFLPGCLFPADFPEEDRDQ